MSPQSRAAAATENTTLSSRDDGWSGNPCSGTSSVADIARAANMEYALHKIESESSATPANPLVHQAGVARKRSSVRISTSPKNEPFLSSYGSAFLSGIFSDIAQSPPEDETMLDSANSPDGECPASDTTNEPCQKKARTTASTSFGRQSCMAMAGLVEGAVSEVLSPSVVSPRPNTSTHKIDLFNDQVRELQDMAFPSLPQIPIAVSSSSCSSASHSVATLREEVAVGGSNLEDQDPSESYGWFVSMDDDIADPQNEPSSAPMFLPDAKPDLAFNAITAPSAGNQDLEVQQALAADTIDDVLGDLF